MNHTDPLSIEKSVAAMRNLGVTLNDYDSEALTVLIRYVEDALAAADPQQAQARQPACKKCKGSGIGDYVDHGFAQHGEEAIEAVRCDVCNGFGHAVPTHSPEVPKHADATAWMWQHEETGRVGFVESWQPLDKWQESNPRLKLISPLYTPEALKAKLKELANARVEKWEQLGNGSMVERAKADAVTAYGMLCDAIEAGAAAR